MRAKICCYPSCNSLIKTDKRYCDKHTPDKKVPFENATRSNETLYNSSQWRSLRKKILKEHPYCYKCGISIKEAELDIHHIVPARGNIDLFYDESNCIPICKSCHRIITAKEIKNRL